MGQDLSGAARQGRISTVDSMLSGDGHRDHVPSDRFDTCADVN